MALVNVVNMTVLDNPTCFLNPFQFEITFECLQELDDDLEWKVLYVGSAHDAQYDQILDEILVGPIPVGLNKFVLQADAPNVAQLIQQPHITSDDILGVTVVLVTCSYKEREFVRIGYYVNNEYHTGEATEEMEDVAPPDPVGTDPSNDDDDDEPPPPPLRPKIALHEMDFAQVQRHILADKPRVTKFPIPWNDHHVMIVKEQVQVPPALTNTTPSTMATLDDDDDERRMETE